MEKDGQVKSGKITTDIIMSEMDRISKKTLPTANTSTLFQPENESSISVQMKTKLRYPWYIVFILGNELCERFAFYGMKAVLTLYFLDAFFWTESTATLVYHVFLVLSYFTPIFGAMIADGYIGKFMTISSLSMVYVGGLILMTLASIPSIGLHPIPGFLSGLMLVAVGTGGIKPCVNSYGGDQFREGQERYREQFFSIFYFCINAGSLVSTFVTPILRSDLPCLGKDGCYPAAFGLPAGLLAIAIVLFVLGKPFYRDIPPTGNIVGRVLMCIGRAIKNKRMSKGSRKLHWLDYASDKYEQSFINDVKQIIPVLKMFLPLPIFWTLFDQKGSRWTLQANKMDGRITDNFYWKPDQVQIFNPVLILILVPIFEAVVYPLLKKWGIEFRLLARMVVGMMIAGLAFVVAGILQIQLDNTLPAPVPSGLAEIRVFNTIPCSLNISSEFQPDNMYHLPPNEMAQLPYVEVTSGQFRFFLSVKPISCSGIVSSDLLVTVTEQNVNSVLLFTESGKVLSKTVTQKKEKPRKGAGFVNFVLPFKLNTSSGGGEMTLINPDVTRGKSGYQYSLEFSRNQAVFVENSLLMDATVSADQGKYDIYLADETSPTGKRLFGSSRLEIPNGGVYTIILKDSNETAPWIRHDIVEASSLNIFLQLPQYFLITLGEVLFSVSGVAFAYSQAPASMKAVLQAGWLMTTAFGNVIVIIISGAKLFESQATEFFVFAGLIGAFALLFAIMTKYYKYVETIKKDDGPNETKEELENAIDE